MRSRGERLSHENRVTIMALVAGCPAADLAHLAPSGRLHAQSSMDAGRDDRGRLAWLRPRVARPSSAPLQPSRTFWPLFAKRLFDSRPRSLTATPGRSAGGSKRARRDLREAAARRVGSDGANCDRDAETSPPSLLSMPRAVEAVNRAGEVFSPAAARLPSSRGD